MLEEGARVTITNQLGPNGQIVRVEAIANETPGLVPVLAHLSDLDSTVEPSLLLQSRCATCCENAQRRRLLRLQEYSNDHIVHSRR